MSPPTRNDLGLDMNNGLATVVFFAFFTGATTVFLGGYRIHRWYWQYKLQMYPSINQSIIHTTTMMMMMNNTYHDEILRDRLIKLWIDWLTIYSPSIGASIGVLTAEDASLVVQVTAITRFSRSRSEDGKLNGSGELSDRYILEKVAVTFWVWVKDNIFWT